MTKLEELIKDPEILHRVRAYIVNRFGSLIALSKIVGSEKVYPFAPQKVREAIARAEEE